MQQTNYTGGLSGSSTVASSPYLAVSQLVQEWRVLIDAATDEINLLEAQLQNPETEATPVLGERLARKRVERQMWQTALKSLEGLLDVMPV